MAIVEPSPYCTDRDGTDLTAWLKRIMQTRGSIGGGSDSAVCPRSARAASLQRIRHCVRPAHHQRNSSEGVASPRRGSDLTASRCDTFGCAAPLYS